MLRVAAVVFLTLCAAAAAPAQPPAGAMPLLTVARVDFDTYLVWRKVELVPHVVEKTVTLDHNGKVEMEKYAVTKYRHVESDASIKLKDIRARDAAGNEIPVEKLSQRLGLNGAPVLLSTGPVPLKYRWILKDDTIVIEVLEPKAQGAPRP